MSVQQVYQAHGVQPQQGRRMPAYYMTNLRHPVVDMLFAAWKKERGMTAQYPVSDKERTEFELQLLRPEVRQKAEEYAAQLLRLEAEQGKAFAEHILLEEGAG